MKNFQVVDPEQQNKQSKSESPCLKISSKRLFWIAGYKFKVKIHNLEFSFYKNQFLSHQNTKIPFRALTWLLIIVWAIRRELNKRIWPTRRRLDRKIWSRHWPMQTPGGCRLLAQRASGSRKTGRRSTRRRIYGSFVRRMRERSKRRPSKRKRTKRANERDSEKWDQGAIADFAPAGEYSKAREKRGWKLRIPERRLWLTHHTGCPKYPLKFSINKYPSFSTKFPWNSI